MAEAPNPYRLNDDVVPRSYAIKLEVDLTTFQTSGSVSVQLDVHRSSSEIMLNLLDLEVDSAMLHDAEGAMPMEEHSLHSTYQTATLHFPRAVAEGPATLEMHFRGRVNDGLHGLYRASYVDPDGVTQVLAATQCQDTHARSVFPCWDEPAFKATYALELTVAEDLQAYANGAEVERVDLGDGRHRVTFAETMPMSTYLVAFAVGRFETTETRHVNGVPLRVITPLGRLGLTSLAMESACFALDFFTEYFAIPYPGDKVDLIAIPDFAFGAMENLGLVTFRDTALLVDTETASQVEMQRVAQVVNHELAHMWFGDLVTMAWWEGIWLNEAFATFMETICTDAFRPEWRIWEGFMQSREVALNTDGLHSTRPIEYEVVTPADATGMFDILTYVKGCAVMRMLEQWITPDVFREGVRIYLKRHAYGNTVTNDLWVALEEASGLDVSEVMDTWILQGGHPHIEVCDGCARQRPFSYLPPRPDSAIGEFWHVPVHTRDLDGGEVISRILRAEDDFLEVPKDHLVNAGAVGVYRTTYGTEEVATLAARLSDLTPVERASLLADSWAAALIGQANPADVLRLGRGLVPLNEPSTWATLNTALGLLDRITDDAGRAVIAGYVRDVHGAAFERIGWEPLQGEGSEVGEMRGMLIQMLGLRGRDQAVIDEAVRRFLADDLRGDVARPATAVAAAQHPPGLEDLLDERRRAATTPQDEQRLLFALASVPDPDVATRTLARCFNDFRTQDAPYLIGAMMTNRHIAEHVWRSLTARWEEAQDRFPASAHARMLGGVAYLCTEAWHAEEIRAFHEANPLAVGQLTLNQVLDRRDVHAAFAEGLNGVETLF